MKKSQANFVLNLGFIAAFVFTPSVCLQAQPRLSATHLVTLQPIDASAAPEGATYWLAKGRNPDIPLPPMPCIPPLLRPLDLPIYRLGGNSFLIDDRSVDYAAMDEAIPMDRALRELELQDERENAVADGSGAYPPGSLWLALAMTNDPTYGTMAAVTINGTTNGTWYEILAKRSLTDPAWWSEGSLQGFTNQAASQSSVTADNSTPNLFLWAQTLTNGSGSTLPIWWQLQNFGRTGLDPNSALGGQGLSLLESYLEGTEPNLIHFSVAAANNYVKHSPASVQLAIASGLPFYQAVSVDNTDFASATWRPWSSTNLSVDLGSAEGWHNVWVGLRGFSASSHPTWQWKRLKLDRTPPRLTLLSPAEGVVTQPRIQLAGSCPEALSAIWYDLSNAVIFLPNQQALILDQYLNTNTWEFTTNTFQAFDVQLAVGTNLVTVHATDLAGNQAATTFTFILDYSTKTNPPAINLAWPRDGVQIAARSFTLHGWTDDPTAGVQAQVTDANGTPHVFFGMVERTGKFWVDNLPLTKGTNLVALTVANAAGKTSSTNISVVQSAVQLTMTPVSPASRLWQPTVNVSGKISDSSYAVWVNGVKAYNPGNGTWAATNVPVTRGNVAVFQMTAYSPDERQPDGSYGR
jgi:hypothetical protein